MFVCVCVCNGSGAGLDYSDARPSYFNLFTEPRTPRRMFENIGPGHGMGWNPASAIGEQQLKRTQSGAAAEADASSELQLKRVQSGSSSWKRKQTGSSS